MGCGNEKYAKSPSLCIAFSESEVKGTSGSGQIYGAYDDYYCEEAGVPVRSAWFEDVKKYEEEVLSVR